MKKPVTASAAIFICWCFCSSLAQCVDAQAQDVTGYWQGTMRFDAGGEYRELLHISKTKNGELSATIEFMDTGGKVVPVSTVSLNESKLVLRMDSEQASYEGTISADASAISGVWKQSPVEMPLNFSRSAPPKETSAKRPSDISGYWTGTVKYDPTPGCDPSFGESRYAFHITNTADGLTATFNVPDNGTLGWAATAVTRDGASLNIEMKQLAGRFQGTINKNKTVIEGIWMQRDRSYPVVLTRSKHLPKPLYPPPPGCGGNGMSVPQ